MLQLTWGTPLTCLSRSLLFLRVAAWLRKFSARDGVEVGAAVGWVPQGCPASYCWPCYYELTRVLLSRMETVPLVLLCTNTAFDSQAW